jgi:hypothetical protein
MTEAAITVIVTAICATLPPTIIALASLRQSKANHDVVLANDEKTDKLLEKTTDIKTSTDGNLAKVTTALEVAQKEIAGLKLVVSAMVDAKDAALNAVLATHAANSERIADGKRGETGATGATGAQGIQGERGRP